jgi:hypothetical protein
MQVYKYSMHDQLPWLALRLEVEIFFTQKNKTTAYGT